MRTGQLQLQGDAAAVLQRCGVHCFLQIGNLGCGVLQEYRWTEAERAAILAQPLLPEDTFTKEWQRLEALQQQVEAAGKRVNRKVAALAQHFPQHNASYGTARYCRCDCDPDTAGPHFRTAVVLESQCCPAPQAVNMFDKAQEEQMALAEKKRVVEEDKAKILEVPTDCLLMYRLPHCPPFDVHVLARGCAGGQGQFPWRCRLATALCHVLSAVGCVMLHCGGALGLRAVAGGSVADSTVHVPLQISACRRRLPLSRLHSAAQRG